MACYYPITMFRSREGRNPETGKWSLVRDTVKGYQDLEVKVPCGQCIGCRLERSRQWAMRCVHEASLWSENCFVTLTFDDVHLDPRGSLVKSDYVLFMKRLRKRFGDGIRFFHCGEYGSVNFRPHHHALLFNFSFPDIELWQVRGSTMLYRSAELERLWPFGFSSIGECNFESAAYVARYVLKKINGPYADDHYQGREKEYITMSRRPGIAHDWLLKYKDDVYPHDYVVIRDGIKCKPPRYYDNIYDNIDNIQLRQIKLRRVMKAREHADNNTPERLAVREEVQLRRAERLLRPLD